MDPVRTRRLAFTISAAATAALLDQATKALALQHLSETDRIPLLGDAFGLQLAFNAGTVLSLGSGSTWLFTILASASMVVFAILTPRTPTLGVALGLGLLWGGAAGNLWDRLTAPPAFGLGRVTDMLAYGDLFIGNVADVAIGAGLGLIALSLWRRQRATSQAPVATDAKPERATQQ
jgi:signal peptidase II